MKRYRTYIEVEFSGDDVADAHAYAEELVRLLEFEGMDVRAWHHAYELYEMDPCPTPPYTALAQ